MTFPGWTRVTDLKFYVEAEDLEDEEESPRALPRRLYRPKGRRYPLLSIGLYSDYESPGEIIEMVQKDGSRLITHMQGPTNGVIVSVSFKSGKGQWWSESGSRAYVPLELFDDLVEMIGEAKQKIIAWRNEPHDPR
jgi:hypothetical protein